MCAGDGGDAVTSRLFRGAGFDQPRTGSAAFDPVVEGSRYRLAATVSTAIWERIVRESNGSGGQRDEELARQRFHHVAARVALRGGTLRPAPGRIATHEASASGADPETETDVFVIQAPGKTTQLVREPRWQRQHGGEARPEETGPPRGPEVSALLARRSRDAGDGAHRPGLLGARVRDPDPVRRALTLAEIGPLAWALELAPEVIDVRVDDDAATYTARHGARGLAEDGVVYLAPDAYRPDTAAGRYLLGHELAHIAQSRRTGDGTADGRDAAEFEANVIAEAYAAGRSFAPPRATLSASAARDTDAKTEEDLLKNPVQYSVAIDPLGLRFDPAYKGQKWKGGLPKAKQAMAGALMRLCGGKYTPSLVKEALAVVAQAQVSGNIVGDATQNEPVDGPYTILAPVAKDLLRWLKVSKGIDPKINAEQMDKLESIDAAQAAWGLHRQFLNSGDARAWKLPRWYREPEMYLQIVVKLNTQLAAFRAARDAHQKDPAKEPERDAAFKALGDEVNRFAQTLDAIRADAALVDEEAYRGLWGMPARDPRAPRGQDPPVAETSEPRLESATRFLIECYSEQALAEEARTSHDARLKLLKNWATRMKYVDPEAATGDVDLRDRPSTSNVPPLKSQLDTYPALQAPFYDRAAGSESFFRMNLTFEDVWQAFGHFDYKWELIRVPEDSWDKHKATAEDQKNQGWQPTPWDTLKQRWRRDMASNEEDMKTVMGGLSVALGPPGLGATDIGGVNLALSEIGSLITTFFEGVAFPLNSRMIPLPTPGLFVVRCSAVPGKPRDPKDTAFVRAPSVAWLPVWVRTAEDMTQKRTEADKECAGSA